MPTQEEDPKVTHSYGTYRQDYHQIQGRPRTLLGRRKPVLMPPILFP